MFGLFITINHHITFINSNSLNVKFQFVTQWVGTFIRNIYFCSGRLCLHQSALRPPPPVRGAYDIPLGGGACRVAAVPFCARAAGWMVLRSRAKHKHLGCPVFPTSNRPVFRARDSLMAPLPPWQRPPRGEGRPSPAPRWPPIIYCTNQNHFES